MAAQRSLRYCDSCGTRLARDNRLPQCTTCQRKTGDLALGPPVLAADFWTSGVIAEALHSWHIGQVIRAYRHHPFHGPRPLSQELVATWLGLTQTQLSRIESGPPVKDLDRLIAWSKILRIPTYLLWFKLPNAPDSDTLRRDILKFGLLASACPGIVPLTLREAPSVARPDPSHAIIDLCGMLMDYGFDPNSDGSTLGGGLPSAQDLERDVKAAFNAYQQGRFTAAAGRVSTLLTDAQLLAHECTEAERSGVQTVLALSYQAAASILTKVGESDLALIAAERGLRMAEAAGNPAVRASLLRCVAFTLHSTGRYESAMRLIESGTGYLDSETSGKDAASLSVHGTLFLVGSMAAARFGNSSKTADYLEEASRSAQRLGKDANHLWTAFGPTNVAIHRVNTAVELGDIGSVLDSGLSLNTEAVPAERRVRYMLDVARAYSMAGNREDAVRTILMAEGAAPEQVHRHYVSRGVVLTLMRTAPGKPTIELGKLAKRMKISEQV